jgi:NACalpha-BTF3-like transcription factor
LEKYRKQGEEIAAKKQAAAAALNKIKVAKEDVDTLKLELDVDEATAEKLLRTSNNDVKQAILEFIKA